MVNQVYIITYSGNKFYSVHAIKESTQQGAKQCEYN